MPAEQEERITREVEHGELKVEYLQTKLRAAESRVQELEGERDRLKAHIRAAITAYATDGSSAEDALLDIEAAL